MFSAISSLHWYGNSYTLYTSTWTFMNSTTFQRSFYPTDWVRACLSIDFTTGIFVLVVDGEILHEGVQNQVVDNTEPGTIEIVLGGYGKYEDSTIISSFNIFSGQLSTLRMVAMTRSSSKECWSPGDVLSWEEAQWTLTSRARREELQHIDGP